jgi:DNA-binding NarL/FixJ family response regulator
VWYLDGVSPVPPPGPHLRRLSTREREVAALLADGLTRREVGHRLGISAHTVGCHSANACAKLGLDGGGRALVAWLNENPN